MNLPATSGENASVRPHPFARPHSFARDPNLWPFPATPGEEGADGRDVFVLIAVAAPAIITMLAPLVLLMTLSR
jgi:hypothetical protein